ncbi:MAG TPA: hypothetical protein DCE18_11865 [Syntrophobacteraceae bacterium]|nr:hypothetical protein [Syntrophobacteraceae bacterium]HBZ56739.1 hypothetical protein [Syntrophobacteraceae bacterium]
MKRKSWCRVLGLVMGLLMIATAASAQEKGAGSAEDQAQAIVKRMADLLKQTKQYTVTMDSEYDVVQDSGEKIEFGETRKMTVARPNRIRVDVESRDGGKGVLVYDGQNISICNNRKNVYASASKSVDLDHLFDHFKDDLEISMPLGQVFSAGLEKVKTKKIRSLYYVEKAIIAGAPCDHLAGTTDKVDFQVYVAQGDQPLPRRIVITYRKESGKPQFRAQLSDWKLNVDVPDSAFVFTPPQGAERIPFLAEVRLTQKERAARLKR